MAQRKFIYIGEANQMYVFTQPLRHGQDETQGQFLRGISKVGDHSQGWREGSLFNTYNTEV